MNQKIAGGILIGICVSLFGIVVVFTMKRDTNPPKIEFHDDVLTSYTKGQNPGDLLQGVSATDAEDGDVSQNIIIENIYDFHDGTAKIMYVIRDQAGNIAKADRMVTFLGGSESTTVELPNSDSSDEAETSDTVEDGNTSNEEATEVNSSSINTATPTPSETAGDTGKPTIRLSQNATEVNRGGSFNGMAYVAEVDDDKDTSSELSRRVQIIGNYNLNKAGTYELTFSVTDKEGNRSNGQAFTLTVK